MITNELNLARNMFGSLFLDIRRRILHYCNNPTPEGWDDIHGIIINWSGLVCTIWQGLCELDPSFINIGRVTDAKGKIITDWKKIPTADEIERALRFLTH